MNISVIIPIYNAVEFLPNLLECLEKNDFKENDEILLIDNGSSDNSYQICLEMAIKNQKLYKVLKYTEKADSYAVRNFGVRQAKNEILVFTDSDTKPLSSWISTIRKTIKIGTIIAGKIELEIINNGLWEHFDSIAHLQSEKNAKKNSIATANMTVFKEDFFKVGYFEERFSGGDYEWSKRAAQKKLTIIYSPEAMVYHPTRKTFEQILKKEQRIAYGTGNHHRNKGKSLFSLIILYILKILKFDTNIKYMRLLKMRGFNNKAQWEFNNKFMIIRFEQLKYVIKGYKMINVRKIGIK